MCTFPFIIQDVLPYPSSYNLALVLMKLNRCVLLPQDGNSLEALALSI